MRCRTCKRQVIPERVNGYMHLDGTISCGKDFGSARADVDVDELPIEELDRREANYWNELADRYGVTTVWGLA